MQPEKQSFIQRLMNAITPASTATYTRTEPVKPNINLDQLASAIAYNETRGVQGDPYKFSRFSGDKKLGLALGKYQITEGDLKTYGPRYLGQPISSKEFLASTTAQDNYIKNKAKFFADQGYTAPDIADIHRAGLTNSFPAGSGKYQNPNYVKIFNQIYNATSTSQ